MASFFEVNLLKAPPERAITGRPEGHRQGTRRPVVEIYIYDEFARLFQETRSILSIWMRRDRRGARRLR